MKKGFSREQRLRNSTEFKHVLSDSRKFRASLIGLYCRPNDLPYARLGISVSKRRVKLAADRNRVKRLVRESFRRHLHDIVGKDVVVMAYSGIDMCGNQTINHQLETLWNQLVSYYDKASSC